MRRAAGMMSFVVASTLTISCAIDGRVLRPVSSDTYLKVDNFHFVDSTVTMEFVMKTDGSEEASSILIENMTSHSMNLALTSDNGRTVIFAEQILPFGQAVLNAHLPLRRWFDLKIETGFVHHALIKFDP